MRGVKSVLAKQVTEWLPRGWRGTWPRRIQAETSVGISRGGGSWERERERRPRYQVHIWITQFLLSKQFYQRLPWITPFHALFIHRHTRVLPHTNKRPLSPSLFHQVSHFARTPWYGNLTTGTGELRSETRKLLNTNCNGNRGDWHTQKLIYKLLGLFASVFRFRFCARFSASVLAASPSHPHQRGLTSVARCEQSAAALGKAVKLTNNRSTMIRFVNEVAGPREGKQR